VKIHYIFTGGSSTWTFVHGLSTDGVYTSGTQYGSFSVSSIITNLGTSNSNGGGSGFPGGPGMP